MIKALDKQYVLSTYARMDISFDHGKGARLFTKSGEEYIDFGSGIGVVSVGHANEKLANSICSQAHKLIHTSNLYHIEPQAKLAQKIVELCEIDGAVFFANSGAEANEGAIKLARKYGQLHFKNKKYKVLTLENSFHGRTITTLKATGQNHFHQEAFSPYPDGFCFKNQIEQLYDAIDDETVGVMIELIQGEGGVYPLDKKAVQELSSYLKQRELLLIVDEVQTGVYRSGEFLACKHYDIKPDIITLAKGLAGGVPIGAVVSSLKDVFVHGDHGSTFGGNFLSTTAGLCVLDILENYKKTGILDDRVGYFISKLEFILDKYKEIFSAISGFGLMLGLRCKDSSMQAKIINKALQEHLLVLRAGKDTVRFLPPLVISKEEIDEGFKRFDKALSSL